MEGRKRRVFGGNPSISIKDTKLNENQDIEQHEDSSTEQNPIIPNSPETSMPFVENMEILPRSKFSELQITAFQTQQQQCPICTSFIGTNQEINIHLDRFHFGKPSNIKQQNQLYNDNDGLNEMKGAIFGFLKTAGQKVKGLGDTITNGKFSSELERLDMLYSDNESTSKQTPTGMHSRAQSSNYPNQEHFETSNIEQPVQIPKICEYDGCVNNVETDKNKFKCPNCYKIYCKEHGFNEKARHMHQKNTGTRANTPICLSCSGISLDNRFGIGGPSKSHFHLFESKRSKMVKKSLLEANRIQKRLEKLSVGYANILSQNQSFFNTFDTFGKRFAGVSGSTSTSPLMKLERSVVTWEKDKDADACYLCQHPFNSFSNRRHHCRLCGRLVCGKKTCSSILDIPLRFEDGSQPKYKKFFGTRACFTCTRSLSLIQERQIPVEKIPIYGLYNALTSINDHIETVVNNLQRLVDQLGNSVNIQVKSRLLNQSNLNRKELQKLLSSYDGISKRIAGLSSTSETDVRLYKSIRQSVMQDLQLKTIKLSSISQILLNQNNIILGNTNKVQKNIKLSTLKGDSSSDTTDISLPIPEIKALDGAILENATNSDTGIETTEFQSNLPERNSKFIESNISSSQTVGNIDELDEIDRETLVEKIEILREQRILVQGYIKAASQKREWSTASSLNTSLSELDNEISSLERYL
ncbi:hypothetical protein BB559_004905 [Furculomyces boomerangus]|uniref:FYVE-type domain-containing protein n=1 Tax=Furculomyces boomerangus TaxID=61424 RepID=A0A2T9YC08_9FUNG|nr:hypothetical protein BB559_004905 [Furculomyces boomerangus]